MHALCEIEAFAADACVYDVHQCVVRSFWLRFTIRALSFWMALRLLNESREQWQRRHAVPGA
eukprot:9248966-Pyramimonas_sp.AAC.1